MKASPIGVRLRPARPSDVPHLRKWDGEPHVVVNAGEDDKTDWSVEVPRQLPWRDILIAELIDNDTETGQDPLPIGVVIIIDPAEEESHYWGAVEPHLRAIDIWIGEPDYINRGFGTRMMAEALDRCFSDPSVTSILIDPMAHNMAARRFYGRLGFVDVGPRRFGSDDCMVMSLSRHRWRDRDRD